MATKDLTPEEAIRKAERELDEYWQGFGELRDLSSPPLLQEKDWKRIAVFRLINGREPTPTELRTLLSKP